MQTIVELTLQAPLELRVVKIPRMQVKVVSVHRDGWISKLDNQLHTIAPGASGEIQQRVLIKAELSEDAFQTWIVTFGHKCIVKAIEKNLV